MTVRVFSYSREVWLLCVTCWEMSLGQHLAEKMGFFDLCVTYENTRGKVVHNLADVLRERSLQQIITRSRNLSGQPSWLTPAVNRLNLAHASQKQAS